MTKCDKIVTFIDVVSTKQANTIATNVTCATSINCHSKKSKRLQHFTYSSINDHINIDNYYYLLLLCKKVTI